MLLMPGSCFVEATPVSGLQMMFMFPTAEWETECALPAAEGLQQHTHTQLMSHKCIQGSATSTLRLK